MTFDWKIALWKAVKTGLVAIIAALAASGDLDKLLDLVKSNTHVPFYLVPVVAIGITVLRNYIKQWLKGQAPVEGFQGQK